MPYDKMKKPTGSKKSSNIKPMPKKKDGFKTLSKGKKKK